MRRLDCDELGARLPSWWPWGAAAALLLIGAVVLVDETRATTFWADEWAWILTRRSGGIGTFLDPHNSHLSLIPVIIYKLLFATAGLSHYWPYRAVLIVTDIACAGLVFLYARVRVGAVLALLAAALILFFGPGWQDILWPFQMAWLLAIGAGVAALLMLDRGDRKGDVAACVLLGISLASSGPGLAIAAGMIVEVLWRRRLKDVWIVAIPAVLYALWWLGYEQSTIFAHSFLLLPRFVVDAAAGVLSSLAGLADINVSSDTGSYLTYGPILLALAALVVAWRLRRLGRIPPRAVTLLVMAVAFWVLTAVGRAYLQVGPLVFTETGDESRYLYVGAILLVLFAVELARGYSPSLPVGVVAAVLVVAAVVSNITPLRDGAALLRTQAQLTHTELGTLDISRPIVSPDFTSAGFLFNVVTAQDWFSIQSSLGSDAFDAAQIAAQPEPILQAADSQLIAIQHLELKPLTTGGSPPTGTPPVLDLVQAGTASRTASCVSYTPASFLPRGASPALAFTMPSSGIVVKSGGATATVGVRRFGLEFQQLGTLAARAQAVLRVKPDLAPQPWHVQIASGAPVTVCGLGG